MLLAAFGGRIKELQTATFNANATWVAPAGTSLLASVVGHGAAGAPAGVQARQATVVSVTYQASGSGAENGIDWEAVQGFTEAAAGDATAGDPYATYAITAHADDSFDISSGTDAITGLVGSVIPQFSGGWHTSGPIRSSGVGRLSYSAATAATTGASATGFGFTFAGGVGGAAAVGTYSNVAITPLASYNIVVPAGATVQITYYA